VADGLAAVSGVFRAQTDFAAIRFVSVLVRLPRIRQG
jgi:hypothetical protein